MWNVCFAAMYCFSDLSLVGFVGSEIWFRTGSLVKCCVLWIRIVELVK